MHSPSAVPLFRASGLLYSRLPIMFMFMFANYVYVNCMCYYVLFRRTAHLFSPHLFCTPDCLAGVGVGVDGPADDLGAALPWPREVLGPNKAASKEELVVLKLMLPAICICIDITIICCKRSGRCS